jgi:hypothetical protein
LGSTAAPMVAGAAVDRILVPVQKKENARHMAGRCVVSKGFEAYFEPAGLATMPW